MLARLAAASAEAARPNRLADDCDEVGAMCHAHARALAMNIAHRETIEALVEALESALGRADAAPGFGRADAVGARVAMGKMHALLEAVLPDLGDAAAKARAAATAVDDLRIQARAALEAADGVAARVRRAGDAEQ